MVEILIGIIVIFIVAAVIIPCTNVNIPLSQSSSTVALSPMQVESRLKIVAEGACRDFIVYKIIDTEDFTMKKFYVIVGTDSNKVPQKISLEKQD